MAMGKKLEGAIKGAMATLPISVGYSAAGNPGGGLLAIGVGAWVGATVAAAKEAPTQKEIEGHHVLSPGQFGPQKFSNVEMTKYNKWHEEAGK